MRPAEGEVLHFSEDGAITEFRPHVPATAEQPDPFVWAVDATRAPDYWFPRECPRAMAWALPSSSVADRLAILGPGGGRRVHAIEYAWLASMASVVLYAYRLPAATFRPFGSPVPHAMVSTVAVRPLGAPERVGDLLAVHAEAGIQLRVLPSIREFWEGVVGSTLGFSGIRLRNASGQSGRGARL